MRQWLIENGCFIWFITGLFFGTGTGIGLAAMLGANRRRDIE